jgi:hypothetical protein
MSSVDESTDLSGSSLDGNTSNSTTTSLATQTKNGGYGLFIGMIYMEQ